MYNKKLITISLLSVLILTMGVVSASDTDVNNALNVSSTSIEMISENQDDNLEINEESNNLKLDENNAANKINVSGNSFSDIQKAINSAKENDIICLNGTYTSSGKIITIKKPVSIQGSDNTVLDGKKLSGFFKITSKGVILNNLIFKNAKVTSNVPAIYSSSGITISGSKFYDTSNKYCFINIVNGKTIIENSSFSGKCNHFATEFEKTKLNVYNSNFTGIGIDSYNSNIVIDNCEFSNYPDGHGLSSERSTVSVLNSRFFKIYNGIDLFECNASISNSSFKNCSSRSISFDMEFAGKLKISSSEFINNTGVCLLSSPEGDCSKNSYNPLIQIINTTFANNKGNPSIMRAIGSDIIFDNCQMINNSDSNYLGSIFLSGHRQITVKNNNMTKKFTTKSNCYVIDNSLKSHSLYTVTADAVNLIYKDGGYFYVTVKYTLNKKPVKSTQLYITLKSGKTVKEFDITTNKNGVAKFKASNLAAGTYKVTIKGFAYEYFTYTGYLNAKSTIKVVKAKTVVKAPKITAKYKRTKYFKVTLTHKTSKKPISGVKVKLKVYTGKKYKTYVVKTNSKGIAKLNTKKLSWGKHKVKILSGNNNCIISGKSSIKIR